MRGRPETGYRLLDMYVGTGIDINGRGLFQRQTDGLYSAGFGY
jgi:hypothetical protein